MPLPRAELQAWLRLGLCPGLGNQGARRLLAALGSPEAIFDAPAATLHTLATPAVASALRQRPEGLEEQLERSWRWLQSPAEGLQHQMLTLGDPGYPSDLLHLPDPPLLLYALSARALDAETARPLQALAVVGSRQPTPQGLENARAFAASLVGQGFGVVSGLALGIDAAAHEGALAASLPPGDAAPWPTLAVVGTGLDRVYPRQHHALAQQVARHGALLSEYPLGTPPLAANFPRRNRLIAALSRGTLVVEAALASGSLVTARLAAEQGKEVFAIPGSIHSPQSRGCHALIRQGAKLVETLQDILEELPATTRSPSPPSPPPPPDSAAAPALPAATTSGDELLDAMGHEPCTLDSLQARCGWPTAQLQARLLTLELAQQVCRLPGGRFQRIGLG